MNISYNRKSNNGSYTSNNTILSVGDIKDVLKIMETLPKNHKKGNVGSLWAYSNGISGSNNPLLSDGVLLVDIDGITIEECDKIINNFDKLTLGFQSIIACWPSHSYYNQYKLNSDNQYVAGLHFALKCDKSKLVQDKDERLDNKEYFSYTEYNTWNSAMLAYYIYGICGVDIRPYHCDIIVGSETSDKICGLDSRLKILSQQIFFNYAEVKFNENVFSRIITDENKIELKNWFDDRPDKSKGTEWIVDVKYVKYKSEFKFQHKSYSEIISDINSTNEHLGYNGRWIVANYLASLQMSADEILDILLKISGPEDFKCGQYKYIKELEGIIGSAIRNHSNGVEDYTIDKAVEILESRGVYFEKEYQEINYNFDKLFLEVWESKKDEMIYNGRIYSKGKNYFEFNLDKNEFLGNYTHQLRDIILKHKAVYIVGDCMIGKTEFAKKMQLVLTLQFEGLWSMMGDGCDLCEPYNSVADNKSKGKNKDEEIWCKNTLSRVITARISDFNWDKRNIFIWNTVKPLYDEYFKNLGLKRNVLFFDECHKLITEDYRWKDVFEMMESLPKMYEHFVFMTGTPAFELDYLQEHFDDICIVKINKEIEYKQEYDILYYEQIGDEDRYRVLKESINAGQLPLVYTNHNFVKWCESVAKLNVEREEQGLSQLRVLPYKKDNEENLVEVNESSSIKDYDVVVATKLLSVGVDFYKDDNRMRCAIIDYASETDCTFQDIHQFTQRNRHQDTVSKVLVRYNEKTDISKFKKLRSIDYYDKFYIKMANIHTFQVAGKERNLLSDELKEQDTNNWEFIWDAYKRRNFGNLVSDKHCWFDDKKNVRLLAAYYKYIRIFSNMLLIKHMLKKRGFTVNEKHKEHVAGKIPSKMKREIFKFFVTNFYEIHDIVNNLDKYDKKSYAIDINTKQVEYIKDNKIYTRSVGYLNTLINEFGYDKEWYEVLKKFDYIPKDTFGVFKRMRQMAKKITNKEIKELKKLRDNNMTEEDFITYVEDLINEHYKEVKAAQFKDKELKQYYVNKIMNEVINDYKKILMFAVDNIEFIEKIKSSEDKGERITAFQQMAIALEQAKNEDISRKRRAAGKKHTKEITVKWIKNGETKKFGSLDEAAEYFNVSSRTFERFKSTGKGSLAETIKIVNS